MSFDSIPTDLVLKMFEHLPFKDRVRLRGVNRLFNEVLDRSINTMRSLDINDELINYVNMSQPFPSLLESCSPMLESITVNNRSVNMWILNALANFVYPKLERLEMTVTNNELTKRLISRNRNLRSVILRLEREFEWPEDIVLEKLEKLEFYSSKESEESNGNVNLSPTLRPLIGMVPNLEHLMIHRESKTASFMLSVQELNQLLAASPCLETLHLNLFQDSTSGPLINMSQDFVAAIPTWHLPKLISLVIALKFPIPPSFLQHFSTSSPQLISIVLSIVTDIDDQALVALAKLKELRILGLPGLGMNKDKFSKLIALLPSIAKLYIQKIDREALVAFPQHHHLCSFAMNMEMTKAEIIDVITNLPSLSFLNISAISDARSHESFTNFVTSTAALFHRNLEIQLMPMRISGNESELNQMKAILEEFQTNGGPVVVMDDRDINVIRYKSLA